jgi:hypothetical protein
LRFHLTPVAMFILQAANTPQMLRDVEHGPLRQGADDVRARGLPQFPVTLDLKTGTELCCILSGITAPRAFHAMHADVEPARAVSDRIIGGKTRKNPVLDRDAVSMRPKSVAIELAVVVVCRIFCQK